MDIVSVFLGIGNALRLKLGTNKKYKIEEMADAISSIETYEVNGTIKPYRSFDDTIQKGDFVSLDENRRVVKYKEKLGVLGIARKRLNDIKIEVIIPPHMEV